jgi:hypothetical protein
MVRRLLVAALVLAAVFLPAQRAEGEPTRFRLCAAVSTTDPRCYNGGVTYEAGRTVFLRGRVSPAHPGFGQVLRRDPGQGRYRVVGTIGIAQDGRIRWSWPTTRRDIDRGRPYLFAFRIPDVARSNPVEIWIVPRDV